MDDGRRDGGLRTVLTEAVLVWKYTGVSVRMGRSYQVNMIRLCCACLNMGNASDAVYISVWKAVTYLSLPLWVYIPVCLRLYSSNFTSNITCQSRNQFAS